MSKPVHSPVAMKAFCKDKDAFERYLRYFDDFYTGVITHSGNPVRFPFLVNSDWQNHSPSGMVHFFIYMDDPLFQNFDRYDGDDVVLKAVQKYKANHE